MSMNASRNFEIVTPLVTELSVEQLRMPNPGEVILAHGVVMELGRRVILGRLELALESSAFVGSHTPWHYDSIHTQGHFTDLGELGVKLAGIRGALPDRNQVRNLIDELDEAAIDLNVAKGDLLVFGGNRSEVPILHDVQTKIEPRKSYFSVIQIK